MDSPVCKFTKVDKLWGHEEIIVNDEFCFKRLVVNKGWRVSYHHHKIKDELFYLEKGLVVIELNTVEYTLGPGQWLRVRPGDWHSFAALADSVLLEASTHDDPSDSYRDPSRLSGRW
jgi:mannose-6-phosphate isomerase-like protein (cupin superfamily)